MTKRGRPFGQYSQALLQAATAGPATMAELAGRALVGYRVARFKVAALARSGHLVALTARRPKLYALPEPAAEAAAGVDLAAAWWPVGHATEAEATELSGEG